MPCCLDVSTELNGTTFQKSFVVRRMLAVSCNILSSSVRPERGLLFSLSLSWLCNISLCAHIPAHKMCVCFFWLAAVDTGNYYLQSNVYSTKFHAPVSFLLEVIDLYFRWSACSLLEGIDLYVRWSACSFLEAEVTLHDCNIKSVIVQTLICAIKYVVYEHLKPLPEKILYADHLTYCKRMPSCSAKVKNEWSFTSPVPHMPTWHVKGQIRFSLQHVKIKGNDISWHFKECIWNTGLFYIKSFHSCDDFVSLIHPLCCIQKEHKFSGMGSISILKWKVGDACTQVQNKELCLITIEGVLCFCCGYQMTDEV